VTEILLAEDDDVVRRALTLTLGARGYNVEAVPDGASALRAARARPPDLVLLDLGLPDLEGVEVVEQMRALTKVPIIVVSARRDQADKVGALDAGADDYVTKPFGFEELLARLRAAERRAAPTLERAEITTAEFTVDFVRKEVRGPDAQVIRLTPTEWMILEVLARQPGVVVAGPDLLREVWGPTYGTETNYLRVYLAQLRKKLEPDPGHPRHLITSPGLGYRFEP